MLTRPKASHVGLCLLLVLTWFTYRPGLSGPFLFDDYANLPALGAEGPVTSAATLARYLTSGTADPTGRPVALASFLIDAHDWPATPYAFKRSNLLLHLVNGTLLFFLLRRLNHALTGQELAQRRRAEWAALLSTACWMVHPLLVSTTLYIVQREAMLPTTFALLGLSGWMKGRDLLWRGRTHAGLIVALGSLSIATLLSVLCKANGILLPALALVVEFGVMQRSQPLEDPAAVRSNRAITGLCGLASAVIVAGLLYLGIKGLVYGIGTQRQWTLGQRLLTESRVIWDYLRLLWLPRAFTPGVFNDQIAVSTSLLSPWTTLPALAGIIGLIGIAVRYRYRAPLASTAILFFLVGHAVESTTIPLELYFEHRNYLPSLLMFWPLGLWVCNHPWKRKSLVAAATLAGLAGLTWMTHSNAELWGNGREQAALWATLNPDSPRAQVNAAQMEISEGQPQKALARLTPLFRAHPEEVQLALNVVAAHCAMHSLDKADLERARNALRIARDPGTLLVSWFGRAISGIDDEPCQGLDLDAISSLADAGVSNPGFPAGRRQDLAHIKGIIALRRNDPAAALAEFDYALSLDPRESAAMQQAALLGSSGYPAEGLRHLATLDSLATTAAPGFGMPMLHAWILQRQQYWPRERAQLESTLQKDLHRKSERP